MSEIIEHGIFVCSGTSEVTFLPTPVLFPQRTRSCDVILPDFLTTSKSMFHLKNLSFATLSWYAAHKSVHVCGKSFWFFIFRRCWVSTEVHLDLRVGIMFLCSLIRTVQIHIIARWFSTIIIINPPLSPFGPRFFGQMWQQKNVLC